MWLTPWKEMRSPLKAAGGRRNQKQTPRGQKTSAEETKKEYLEKILAIKKRIPKSLA